MTWTSFHRRGDVLRAVIAAADARRDGVLPTHVPGVPETFVDDADLVAALTLKWHTRLAGRIEREQLHEPMDLRAAVVRAWRASAAELPGVRAVLDAPSSDPAVAHVLRTSAAKEHMMLAAVAGLASPHDRRGIAVGAAIEAEARSTPARAAA
jgi:hypothetical protein